MKVKGVITKEGHCEASKGWGKTGGNMGRRNKPKVMKKSNIVTKRRFSWKKDQKKINSSWDKIIVDNLVENVKVDRFVMTQNKKGRYQ